MGDESKKTKSSAANTSEGLKYENPNDPLYLHHSDQPGAILVSQPLTENNYSTWSRSMIMALSAKNKVGFIDGSIKKPSKTEASEFSQWSRCNDLVKSWLLNSLSKDISASVIYCDYAHEIWADLKERYSQVNSVHLFHIEKEIHDCDQGGMTIGSYFTKLKGLWDEHDALCSIPTCSCDTMKEVLDYQQSQKTMKFLMGLNDSYDGARSQILLMDSLPKVNKAYSLVLRHERQREVSAGKESVHEATAFAVRDNNKLAGSSKKNISLKCGICDKVGHTLETCRAHLKCDYCGLKGHTIDYCRNLQRTNQRDRRNFARTDYSKGNHVASQSENKEASNSFLFTQEQCQQIMNLLNNNKSTSMVHQVGSSSTINELSGPTLGEDDWDGN